MGSLRLVNNKMNTASDQPTYTHIVSGKFPNAIWEKFMQEIIAKPQYIPIPSEFQVLVTLTRRDDLVVPVSNSDAVDMVWNILNKSALFDNLKVETQNE